MTFLNSLLNRLVLACLGGFLYTLLTYYLLSRFGAPIQFIYFFSGMVFLFYLGSRVLLLFSGIETLYYSKGRKEILRKFCEESSFYQIAQRVGKFYHYHDLVLFGFLVILGMFFVGSLIFDTFTHQSVGSSIQSLLDILSF